MKRGFRGHPWLFAVLTGAVFATALYFTTRLVFVAVVFGSGWILTQGTVHSRRERRR